MPLAILSVAIIFFALLYVTATMIIGSGHPKVAVVIMGISTAISAVLNYIFVRRIHDETVGELEPVQVQAQTGSPQEIVWGAVETARAQADFAGPWLIESTQYMQWASMATLIAMFIGFMLSVAWLWYRFGAAPPFATIGRLGLVAAVLYGIHRLVALPVEMVAEYGNIVYLAMVVGKMSLMGVVALVVLVAAREFTATDWQRATAVLSRDKNSGEEAQ